jgi:pimeloyl-ACP methyl ester carboxylesterase
MMTVSPAETIVLVHGSCHGGWCWNKLIPFLKGCDFEIHTPALTGLGERSHLLYEKIDLSTHIKDVVQVFEYQNLHEVTLIGHSYGGMVIGGWRRECLIELSPWSSLMHISSKMAKALLI